MKKNEKLIRFIIFIISVSITVLLVFLILDTTGKINQGKFRINDFVITSIAKVDEVQDKTEADAEIKSLSDFKLNITQSNDLTFLIAKIDDLDKVEITNIYLDNIKLSYPKIKGDLFLYQDNENKINLLDKNIKYDLVKIDTDGQYLVNFKIDNFNCIQNAVLPENTSTITFDGSIFNILNFKISDINFKISFNLNVVDSSGKINICSVNIDMPNESLIKDGMVIIKEDLSKYNFYLK